MKHLFIFAHPDDETVACAGTISKLRSAGEEVLVVTVTDGAGGEVNPAAQALLAELKSVGQLRQHELRAALAVLSVDNYQVLPFTDGQITNEMVWGVLRSTLIDVIDAYRPDFVYTFDHSGWYFHLDHVATSIATTWAVQEAKYPPTVFFLSHFRVSNSKWKYVYSKKMPVTHVVDVTDLKPVKLAAFDAHQSQNLTEPRRQLENESPHLEYFQLAFPTPAARKLLKNHWLFQVKH